MCLPVCVWMCESLCPFLVISLGLSSLCLILLFISSVISCSTLLCCVLLLSHRDRKGVDPDGREGGREREENREGKL